MDQLPVVFVFARLRMRPAHHHSPLSKLPRHHLEPFAPFSTCIQTVVPCTTYKNSEGYRCWDFRVDKCIAPGSRGPEPRSMAVPHTQFQTSVLGFKHNFAKRGHSNGSDTFTLLVVCVQR